MNPVVMLALSAPVSCTLLAAALATTSWAVRRRDLRRAERAASAARRPSPRPRGDEVRFAPAQVAMPRHYDPGVIDGEVGTDLGHLTVVMRAIPPVHPAQPHNGVDHDLDFVNGDGGAR